MGFFDRQDGRLAFLDRIARAPDRISRIGFDNISIQAGRRGSEFRENENELTSEVRLSKLLTWLGRNPLAHRLSKLMLLTD